MTITDQELGVFLRDYEKNTTVSILEGSEKDEIIAIAKAKDILLEGSRDLAGMKCIYTFPEKANLKNVRIPYERLIRALPTIIGKNVDIDHIRRYTIGYCCDFRYNASKKQAIVYAIIFKSVFKDEWNEIKKAFKSKKLTVSSEIWHPEENRKYLSDGTYELGNFTFAGLGIVLNTTPLFPEAKVLEFASMERVKNFIDKETYEPDLIFASVNKKELKSYKENDLITASTIVLDQLEQDSIVPEITEKIVKCSVCGTETKTSEPEIKCPNCLAIIDSTGKVLYPPQILDFSIRCPNQHCGAEDWLVIKRTEKDAEIRCNVCLLSYRIIFQKDMRDEFEKLLTLIYTGQVSCLQCGTMNNFTQTSNVKKRKIRCVKCGLIFEFDIYLKNKRQIKEITKIKTKIKKSELLSASIEGGKEMLIISKYHRILKTPSFDKLNEKLITQDYAGMELASVLKTEQRDEMTDKMFAVVIRVRDVIVGKMRKIRKYPIHDAVHIRNSWVAINQESAKEFFVKYGVNYEKTKLRIEQAGKALGANVKDAVKDYDYQIRLSKKDKLVKKAVKRIRGLKKEKLELVTASINPLKEEIVGFKESITKLETQIKEKDLEVASVKKFYIDNSKLISKRSEDLGEEYIEVASVKRDKLIEDDYFDLCKFRKEEGEDDLKGMEVASKKISVKKEKGKSRLETIREKVHKDAYPENFK